MSDTTRAVQVAGPGKALELVERELAGRIEALGDDTFPWEVGRRVRIGWFGANCGYRDPCRRAGAHDDRDVPAPAGRGRQRAHDERGGPLPRRTADRRLDRVDS
ncbi:MAG: hypothetical protein JOY78_13540 [Pseudonocardia sp.]|nr:hypothetical protein [Pseudonocardia sp.]